MWRTPAGQIFQLQLKFIYDCLFIYLFAGLFTVLPYNVQFPCELNHVVSFIPLFVEFLNSLGIKPPSLF